MGQSKQQQKERFEKARQNKCNKGLKQPLGRWETCLKYKELDVALNPGKILECYNKGKDITFWCFSFLFHFFPWAQGVSGYTSPACDLFRHSITSTFSQFIKEMRSSQKKQNNSPYSVSSCENLNSRNGEININTVGKGGGKSWIRWKVPSTFNTWQQLLPSPHGSLLLTMYWSIHLRDTSESHQTRVMCNTSCV